MALNNQIIRYVNMQKKYGQTETNAIYLAASKFNKTIAEIQTIIGE